MELDELHVRDRRARAPGHGHAVAGRDVGIGRVEINLAAAAGGQDEPIGPKVSTSPRLLIQHINAEAAIFGREAQLAGGDQIDRHVVFEQFDAARSRRNRASRALSISAPVTSWACRMRRLEWPPSLPRSSSR